MSVAPSIFVPITTDLAAPFPDRPKNEVERIERTISNLEVHIAKVKANIVEIAEQEKQAIMRDAKDTESNIIVRANQERHEAMAAGRVLPETVAPPTGLTAEELDFIGRSVEAPAMPGQDYNVQVVPPVAYDPRRIQAETLRENCSRRVLQSVERAVGNVEGYGAYMEAVMDEHRKALRAEVQGQPRKDSRG
jgi:hypothetical protein